MACMGIVDWLINKAKNLKKKKKTLKKKNSNWFLGVEKCQANDWKLFLEKKTFIMKSNFSFLMIYFRDISKTFTNDCDLIKDFVAWTKKSF